MALLKPQWLPSGAAVKRVISHWTAGTYSVHSNEEEHYHFLIDGDADVHKGDPDVGETGSHTRMLNSGSVGVSICSMANAQEGGPYGSFSLKQNQWESS